MGNLVSGSFLLALWWKQLTAFAVLICLTAVAAVRIALRKLAERALQHESAVNIAERLKQLTEQR